MVKKTRSDKRWAEISLVVFALLLRACYLYLKGGVAMAGDTQEYLDWSHALAIGNFTYAKQFPLYQLYPLLLSPGLSWSGGSQAGLNLYIGALHVLLSTATVWLVYRTGRILGSEKYGLLVGLLVAIHPIFINWLPLILTEPLFLFALSLFLFLFFSLRHSWSLWKFCFYGLGSALIFFSRPTSLPLVLVSLIWIEFEWLAERKPIKVAARLTAVTWGVFFILSIAVVLPHTAIRRTVVNLPVVRESLNWSLRISTNDQASQVRIAYRNAIDDAGNQRLAYSDDPSLDALGRVLKFIRHRPLTYASMALKRFISFWCPWVYATTWSRAHSIFDFVVSLGLIGGALLLFFTPSIRSSNIRCILVMAISLSMLCTFGLIDTDGRYRLPAELLLFLVAPSGWLSMLRRVSPGFFSASNRRPLEAT